MSVDFFMLNRQQVEELAMYFLEWYSEVLNSLCVECWYFEDHRVKREAIPQKIKSETSFHFGCESYISSEKIYDLKSYRRVIRELLKEDVYSNEISDVSYDYLAFYDEHFRNAPKNADDWKKEILAFFQEKGRKYICAEPGSDLYCSVLAVPYRSDPNAYYGGLYFDVLAFCIEEDMQIFTNSMQSFLKQLSARFQNINARLGLSPFRPPESSAYMLYFDGQFSPDNSHISNNVLPSEWYKSYYLTAVEWFNVVSPLTQKHIPKIREESATYPSLAVEEIESGGIIVQVKKHINELEVQDLLPVKMLLYNALYPAKRSISKEYILSRKVTGIMIKPRSRWELIPLMEDEIIVTDEEITFKHRNVP